MDKVGYGKCVISCLLKEVVCLSVKVTVRAKVSHCEVYRAEVVVCSAVSSYEWGLRFETLRAYPLYTVVCAMRLLHYRLCTLYGSV